MGIDVIEPGKEYWWKWGPFSGVHGEYVDLDFTVFGLQILIHIKYGESYP